MAHRKHEIRKMPDSELETLVTDLPDSQYSDSTFIRDELARRNQDRQTKSMLRYTKWITAMTGIMTLATIVNIFIAIQVLCK